jgi:hypothetical protein
MFQTVPSITLFPSENWVTFWKVFLLQLRFWTLEISSCCPKGHSHLSWKTHVSLQRRTSVLKASSSSTLFPYENWVIFDRNSTFNLDDSKWRLAVFVSNRPTHVNWMNTCFSRKKTICHGSQIKSHIVSLWELNEFLKGKLPATYVFQGVYRLCLFHIGLFSSVQQTHVSLQRNHLC